MAIDGINLDSLSVDELNKLISKAREVKSKKATPSIKINGYVTSVGKHVNGALEAIKKLSMSEGVSEQKWGLVEAQLKRLSPESFQSEADKIKITPRNTRGGRRKK